VSLAGNSSFAVESLCLDGLEGNTSILLTGEDTAALEAVFYRLVAAPDGEQSVLLSTESSPRSTNRQLNGVVKGADERGSILTNRGSGRGENVVSVDDIGDLTRLGMEFSGLFAEAQQEPAPVRAGILLCSSLLAEADDTRSVYRFLNSNFLSPLRRSKALGVAALDTSADIGSNVNSTITGLETSFNARIHVESTGRNEATLEVSGLATNDGSVEVAW
jgi:hypothetical protein